MEPKTESSQNRPVLDVPFNGALQPVDLNGVDQGSLLDQAPSDAPGDDVTAPRRPVSRRRLLGLGVLLAGCMAALVLGVHLENAKNHAQEDRYASPSSQIKARQLPLASISKQLGAVTPAAPANAVTVNGRLQVSDSLILQPSVQSGPAVTGQLYYNQATNALAYYNGRQFVSLQGGGNTYITNNAGNTSITNNTFITNGGGFGGSGTPGTLALFASPASLGDSLLSQHGSAVSIASNTVAVGTGSGMAAIQGGDGGISLVTAGASGSSGAVTIESGASSTTSSGDVTVDTGANTINGLVVEDYGFETGIEGGFTNNFVGSFTLTQDCTVSHSGGCSMNMTGSDPSGGGNFVITQQPSASQFPVTPGHHYVFSLWVKAGGAGAVIDAGMNNLNTCFYSPAVSDNSAAWTHITWSCTAPAGFSSMGFEIGFNSGAVETHYFDDITVTDISSSSNTAALKLGAANAQSVTIGNVNETGATAIYGSSGISLNSGAANIAVSGGEINVNAAAASSFATSAGALTLTSASAAVWGVGAASSGAGGGLTLQAGTAADGTSNGGNLTLQAGGAAGSGVSGSVLINTGAESGTTGTITIESGSSSTTASGDVTIDTGNGFVSGTVVGDLTFEDNTDDNLVGWFDATTAATNAAAHTGTYSLAATVTASPWGVGQNENFAGFPVTAGHHIFFSAWIRAATVSRRISSQIVLPGGPTVNISPITDVTTGWTEISGSATVPAGVTQAYVDFTSTGLAGEVHYIDDVELTDLSSSSSTSSLDLGSTNAQIVTVGNMNEIGATTIEGGSGITLASGAGPITASGGAINFNGTAASSFGTSSGSLSLNAGGGTGGGVTVKLQADSATAFQVQNDVGVALLSADTAGMTITITGSATITGSITVDGHIVTGGGTPGVTAGAAACTSPPAPTITGTDTSGTVSVTTGTSCTSGGALATITFSNAFGAVPHVILTPNNADTPALEYYVDGATTSSAGFTVGAVNTPGASTVYSWNYQVLQ